MISNLFYISWVSRSRIIDSLISTNELLITVLLVVNVAPLMHKGYLLRARKTYYALSLLGLALLEIFFQKSAVRHWFFPQRKKIIPIFHCLSYANFDAAVQFK